VRTATVAASGPARPRRSSARPVRLERVDQPFGRRLNERREARSHCVEAKRRCERIAVAAVLSAVEREHARPNDLACGEAGIVDREARRVAQRPQREIAPCHEPAPQRGQPRHRLALAQPRVQRMRIELELVEAGGGADRRPALPRPTPCFIHALSLAVPGAAVRAQPATATLR
jgi:hypothetical protein